MSVSGIPYGFIEAEIATSDESVSTTKGTVSFIVCKAAYPISVFTSLKDVRAFYIRRRRLF